MDSGNSGGSLQSSSGGDVNHNHPIPILQPSSSFFNTSSFSQSLNPNNPNPYDLDSLWSRNPTLNPVHNLDNNNNNNNPSAYKGLYHNSNNNNNNNIGDDSTEKLGVITKNPKKRSRASRRAPTTVLTTDTTNFRQMVQEFTGIPAAPFSTSASSSASFSRRLDLYAGSGMIKPSAQKAQLQHPSFFNNNNNNNSVTAPTSNFQLAPSEMFGVTKQPLNLSNLQSHQMFPFQSLSETSLTTQQVNVTDNSDAFVGSSSTSLKRWRGENENLVNFEERNGNLMNSQNVVVSNDGDQLPGNEDSWICRSD